jgi:hypothetical protein
MMEAAMPTVCLRIQFEERSEIRALMEARVDIQRRDPLRIWRDREIPAGTILAVFQDPGPTTNIIGCQTIGKRDGRGWGSR